MNRLLTLAVATGLAAMTVSAPATSSAAESGVENVVLVHGAFADGSSWNGVYDILTRDGFNVSIVQNPLSSLDDDVAATKRVLSLQTGPVILVGHSWGGVVITEAGVDPKVAGLVYIAAFAPDVGESVQALAEHPAPDAPVVPLIAPVDGFLFLDKTKYHDAFVGDAPAEIADRMAAAQAPWGLAAFAAKVTQAAWKTKPSWFLIPSGDQIIGAGAEHFMAQRAGSTIVEFDGGSHAIMVMQAEAVAKLIEDAAAKAPVNPS